MYRKCSFRWTTLLVILSSTMVTLTAADACKGVSRTHRLRKFDSELGDSAESNSDFLEAPVRKAIQRSVHSGRRRNLTGSTGAECPIDLSDLSDVRVAITDTCSRSPPPTIPLNNTWPPGGPDACCNIVQVAYGILQAQWTETSGFFRVENEAVQRSCISEYARRVEDLGTGLHVEICFSDSFYKYSNRQPALCKPKTVDESAALLGNSTVTESVRAACNGDLLESQACGVCHRLANEMLEQVSQVGINTSVTFIEPDGNLSDLRSAMTYDCLYATVTYITAVLFDKGPADPGMQTCLYIMPPPPFGGGSDHAGLLAGVTVAAVLLFLMAASLLLP